MPSLGPISHFILLLEGPMDDLWSRRFFLNWIPD